MAYHFDKIVPDTSIIIEGILSEWKEVTTGEIIIHTATVQELEHQANEGKAKGLIGLDEIKRIRAKADEHKYRLTITGEKLKGAEIQYAKKGEIDAKIRDLAYAEDATLITADKVQAETGEALGIKVFYHVIKKSLKKLKLESFFDDTTMSVHLKENTIPYAKKGFPGKWEFVELRKKPIQQEELREISREIIEEASARRDSFIEIERVGSTIIQLGKFRTVITKPPFSDGWEITAVRPVKQLTIDEYHMSEKLRNRIETQAEGVLIAGAPGAGKTTCVSSLAINYLNKKKTIKTIEAPRDLVLPDEITQYAISHGTPQEIHDILLLTRPDYTLFDEMRNTDDFKLYADMRLSGVGLLGVMHATKAIDAIQRFVGRIELGVIPHIIDTVLFIKNGQIDQVLALAMMVKVPAGMIEEDLARPVVVVTDFETGKPEYELYTYGEQTVVVPIAEVSNKKNPLHQLAEEQIEQELMNDISNVKVHMVTDHKAELYVPKQAIPGVIGKQGVNIEKLEKRFGVHFDVKELSEAQQTTDKKPAKFSAKESKKAIVFETGQKYAGKEVDIYVDNHFLFASTLSKKAELKVNKRSKMGQTLIQDVDDGRKIELRV